MSSAIRAVGPAAPRFFDKQHHQQPHLRTYSPDTPLLSEQPSLSSAGHLPAAVHLWTGHPLPPDSGLASSFEGADALGWRCALATVADSLSQEAAATLPTLDTEVLLGLLDGRWLVGPTKGPAKGHWPHLYGGRGMMATRYSPRTPG